MIFNYLQYLKPILYFNLKPNTDFGYFPTEKQLKEAGFTIPKDARFISEEAKRRDLAWTAFQQGIISSKSEPGFDIWQEVKLPVHDEYVFLRKNFHWTWVSYVMAIRIVTFHNPFIELFSFIKTRKVSRFDYAKNAVSDAGYNAFQSQLVTSQPLVSIVIPTLNRYEYLKDVLRDLENQTYTNFEVIIVDQTDGFKEEFYKGWNLNLKYWFQEEKALWRARNEAVQSAVGDFVLMSEDDIRFNQDFIEKHLKTIDYFNCDVSCGVFFPEGSIIPKERSYFKYSEQFATGNALLKREIFNKVGLFDRQFEKQRMGDGEFGLRLYLSGFKLISNPKSFCYDVKAPSGGLRQMGSWDGWRPKKLLGPRPVPSVLYLSRKYFGDRLSRWYVLHAILPSLVPYQFKSNKLLKILSFVLIPFLLPLVCYQVGKSWRLASDKLAKGFFS
jgi:glycosyltransferase involved in cell wall biosynthesis